METLLNFAVAHKAAAMVAGAWLVRETPALWGQLVKIYPYCADNGGVGGILRNFFVGRKPAEGATAIKKEQ